MLYHKDWHCVAFYGTVWHDGIINYSMKSMGSGIVWHCMAVFDGAGNRTRTDTP